jgi:apolipoprotein N-acyltransferase
VNLVRHTTDGLSAAFDYQGHALASMDHFHATDHAMIAQVPTKGVRTIYLVIGDLFAWLSMAALVPVDRACLPGGDRPRFQARQHGGFPD